jgi:hypothetical protein
MARPAITFWEQVRERDQAQREEHKRKLTNPEEARKLLQERYRPMTGKDLRTMAANPCAVQNRVSYLVAVAIEAGREAETLMSFGGMPSAN